MENILLQLKETLNRCLSLLIAVDKTDIANLGIVHQELLNIANNSNFAFEIRKYTEEIANKLQGVILEGTNIEGGINEISSLITNFIEKVDQSLNKDEKKISLNMDSTNKEKTQRDIPEEELCQLRKQFAQNQNDIIFSFESYLLSLEEGNKEALSDICRILHTWKGEFGFLGLEEYSKCVHKIEDLIKNNSIDVSFLLDFKDTLQNILDSAKNDGIFPPLPSKYQLLITEKSEEEKKNEREVITSSKLKIDISHIEDESVLCEFINESLELINKAESLLLELEVNPDNKEIINGVFRASHTIKGSAGFLNFTHVQILAHTMEDILSKARDSSLPISEECIDLLLHGMDILREIILSIKKVSDGEEHYIPECFDTLISNLKNCKIFEESTSCEDKIPKPPLGEILLEKGLVSKEKLDEALEMQKNGDQRKIGEILIKEANIKPRDIASALSLQKDKKTVKGSEDTIRIPVEKLDSLIDSIGEAVIANSMLIDDQALKNIKSHEFQKKISRVTMIMRRIQEQSMSLRMISIKPLFQKMARVVRDLAQKSGKKVIFKTEGEDTELDKTVVENLGDPLLHMVRNAVDHGIEYPEERLEKGKPEQGTLWLRAYHRGGGIYIEIEDDGKGLDKEAILQKAIEKGLCKKETRLTEQEIYQFIFMPGFSTAKKITEISGRGVGMDVVRKAIDQLRGSIEINSTYGKGTKFTVRLPLTLAIIDGLVVKVGNSRFIIPMMSIIECISINKNFIHNFLNGQTMIKVRDSVMPFFNLDYLLELKEKNKKEMCPMGIIIEDSLSGKCVLGVDTIESQQQVVIKSLNLGSKKLQGISGGAIMSDGSVCLILDPASLVRMALQEIKHG